MKLHILVAVSAVILGWICQAWYKNYIKCSTSYIQRTCEEYQKSTIYNSLCDSVCMRHDLTVEECLQSTTFNKSVFAVRINGLPTILKINTQWFDDIQTTETSLKTSSTRFNVTAYFDGIVTNYFGNNCLNCKELGRELITMADSNRDGQTTSIEAIWFGSLLTKQETFMLAALNSSKSTVNFIGFCGAFYIVEKVLISNSKLVDTSKAFTDFWALPEFAEPIESFFKDILGDLRNKYRWFGSLHEYIYILIKRFRQDKIPTLEQRIQFISGTLQLLQRLATFKYGEVIWCDILYENIAFTTLGNFSSVVLTDLDELFSARNVFQNVGNSDKKCAENTDCLGENYDVGMYYHLECSPFCQDNGFCSNRPRWSNLAYLCNSLFPDVIFNPVVTALSEEDVSKDVGTIIYWILKDCAKSLEYGDTDEYLASIRAVAERFRKVENIVDRN